MNEERRKNLWHARTGGGVLMIAVVMVALVIFVSACSSEVGVAAKYGNDSLSEDEVSEYTAAYRSSIDAEDDTAWARYLRGQGLEAKTWREKAIRDIVGRRLIEKKAEELGITINEAQVEAGIASEKAQRGVVADDEDAWSKVLEQDGMTSEKFARDLGYASILEQVLLEDGAAEMMEDEDTLQSYIKSNLMDRVVRRFSVLSFGVEDESEAQGVFAELSQLSGDELKRRFDEIAADLLSVDDDLAQGDLGWNLLYDTNDLLDGDKVLALEAGDLYPEVVKRDTGWQIYLCSDVYVFKNGVQYAELQDDSLKNAIARACLVGSWGSWAESYVAQLVNEANIEVFRMPAGLDYDVDDIMASL